VLIGVTEARARATQVQVKATTPLLWQQFQAAQGELSSALSRLMVVVEKYPELKSDQNFRDLQAQLEGTENRITVARNRYIQAVQDYNVTIRRFPTNLTAMIFGYKVKPNFAVENEAAIANRRPWISAHRRPRLHPPLRPTEVVLASRRSWGAARGDPMVVATIPLDSRPLLRGLLLAAWLWLMAAVVAPAYAQQGLVAVPSSPLGSRTLPATLAADQSSALEAKLGRSSSRRAARSWS